MVWPHHVARLQSIQRVSPASPVLPDVFSITGEPCKSGCTDRDVVWLRIRVDPRNHVVDGVQIPPWEGAILRGKGCSIVKYRDNSDPRVTWVCVHGKGYFAEGGMQNVALPPLFGGKTGSPSNTKCPGLTPTSIPSGILMHPAIWLQ